MNIVRAKAFNGFRSTILQVVGIGPKMTVVCGKCRRTFSKRIDVAINNPVLQCVHCGSLNELKGLKWN